MLEDCAGWQDGLASSLGTQVNAGGLFLADEREGKLLASSGAAEELWKVLGLEKAAVSGFASQNISASCFAEVGGRNCSCFKVLGGGAGCIVLFCFFHQSPGRDISSHFVS